MAAWDGRERRRSAREAASVTVRPIDTDEQLRTRNIGANGLFVARETAWPVGSIVEIEIRQVERSDVAVSARVVHASDEGCGLELLEPFDLLTSWREGCEQFRDESQNESPGERNGSLLFWCESMDGLDRTRILLELGADIECRGSGEGIRPLARASMSGGDANVPMVRMLLEHGASVDAQDNFQNTALHWAAYYGHPAICRVLLEAGAKPDLENDEGQTPLFRAVHSACAGLAIDRSPRPYLDVVPVLLELGADPNRGDKNAVTPLHEACAVNFAETVGILLDHGAAIDVPSRDGSPLAIAARKGWEDLVGFLLERGARDVDGALAVCPTVPSDSERRSAVIPIARRLLAAGANLEGVDRWQRTALFNAVLRGRGDVARFLLDQGADPSTTDGDGVSALAMATKKGLEEVVELLRSRGAH